MNSIFGFLEPIERLVLKVLLWIILIPKTILKIILDPDWAPLYIQKEFEADVKDRFDEYISPIFLFLFAAVIPAIFLNIVPKYGIEIVNPEIGFETLDRTVSFQAKANFITSRDGFMQEFYWTINKVTEPENLKVLEEYHRQYFYENNFENIITDEFNYEFSKSGEYSLFLIGVNCSDIDWDISVYSSSKSMNDSIKCVNKTAEYYYTDLKIIVPEDSNQKVKVVSSLYNTPITKDEVNHVILAERFTKELQNQGLIFAILAMFILPLSFSVLTKFFREDSLGEYMLRNSFYTQCYYFTPISLAVWGTYYANYFWTHDVLWGIDKQIGSFYFFLPPAFAYIWLIIIETNELARERKIGKIKSFVTVLLFTFLIFFITYLLFSILPANQDTIRKFLLRIYPILGVLLGFLFIVSKIQKALIKK